MSPLIICLTPVKNEAWILDRFLQCASLWADHIIIADQMSTDGSREIALKYPKVQLIDNKSEEYNEYERQKLLLVEARRIYCSQRPNLLITLDADEFLSSNFLNSPEWEVINQQPKGTIIQFNRLNIHPDLRSYWAGGDQFPWGFMDDCISEHEGTLIHSNRIPLPNNALTYHCHDIKVLHYQFTDWARMQSKHRWYQCFEMINRPHLHPISIFRIYHHMYAIDKSQLLPLKPEWFDFYEKKGIDMHSIHQEKTYHWDKQIEAYFEKYTPQYFALLDIWQSPSDKFPDPRNFIQKKLHRYLMWSQYYYVQKFPVGTVVRYLDKFLTWIF